MAKTRHIHSRMSQRGITQEMIDLVLLFGDKMGDRIILGRKGVQGVIDELDDLRSKLLKVMDKGGLVVVAEDGFLITTYRLTSFDQNKAVRKSGYRNPVPERKSVHSENPQEVQYL